MSIWEHKAADEIAGAVEKHIRSSSANSQHGYQLIGIYKAAKKAAITDQTNAENLSEIKTNLCSLCRGQALYECDVAEGWSAKCAFLKQNN